MTFDELGPVRQKPACSRKSAGVQPLGVLHTAPGGSCMHVDVSFNLSKKKPGLHKHVAVTSSCTEFAGQLLLHEVLPAAGWDWPAAHVAHE